MQKDQQIKTIETAGLIAIVRFNRSEEIIKVVRAINEGGVKVIEITMTTPNALNLIEAASQELNQQVLLGAGTVLDPETARAAIIAGAEFIVAPTLNVQVIEVCHRYNKVVIPGAFTPTEILTAWEYGADFVKLFPAELGGPALIKSILAPLPQIKLIPVGGVSLNNIKDYFHAGAAAVAVGSKLVDKKAVSEQRFADLTELARQYVAAVGLRHPSIMLEA
ncbi:MAG: bifunctional 4-hydroxy-2-oxoglutarate aldolase/2-dehydro-3-deoxy-phosphogluconate aldolase [Anaerolineaceae bacterium]|nr:bifunctional 4-hydroxy-2-oxoglutarate aldolase/2-dehydro-3-deoxy-phosphogluconate aldolase [Anaerolineaceae bacterium]